MPAAPYDIHRGFTAVADTGYHKRPGPTSTAPSYRQQPSASAVPSMRPGPPSYGSTPATRPPAPAESSYDPLGPGRYGAAGRGMTVPRPQRNSISGGSRTPSPNDRIGGAVYNPSNFGPAGQAPVSTATRRRSISGSVPTTAAYAPLPVASRPRGYADEARRLPPPAPTALERSTSYSSVRPPPSQQDPYGVAPASSSSSRAPLPNRITGGLCSPNLPPALLSRARMPSPPIYNEPEPSSSRQPATGDRIMLPSLSGGPALMTGPTSASLSRDPKITMPPLASGGIRQRAFATRHQCSPEQEHALRRRFGVNAYIDSAEAEQLAGDIGMTSKEVKRWYVAMTLHSRLLRCATYKDGRIGRPIGTRKADDISRLRGQVLQSTSGRQAD